LADTAIGVITFRRPEQLERLLDALSRLRQPRGGLEVIVVDNDPQASGRAVATRERGAGSSTLAVRYCVEPEPGIVAARNRCVAEFLSTGAASLAFIDDDEWPKDDSWLINLLDAMQRSAADVVAGDVLSTAGDGTPEWATRILYEPSRRPPGAPVPIFYTGNVLIARRVLEYFAPPFDTRFAMTGASDYHFALRCARAGFTAVFADALVLEEFPADRATLGWFLRRGFRSGAGFTRSHLLEDPLIAAVPRTLALAAVRCLRGVGSCLRGGLRGDYAGIVKGLFRIASGAGTASGLFGLHYEEYRRRHR